jgi:hypothetical protein
VSTGTYEHRRRYVNTGDSDPQADNASHSALSMVSIMSFLVFDLTIRQIVEDFRVRGAGDADH